MQCHFWIDDVLLHSGDTRDEVAKLSKIVSCFLVAKFWVEATQVYDRILYIWVTIEHVAKFGDDRPSDLGRLGNEKKERRSKLQR